MKDKAFDDKTPKKTECTEVRASEVLNQNSIGLEQSDDKINTKFGNYL